MTTSVRLRRGGPAFALWALLVALVSADGSAITGLVLNPLWWIWLGAELRRTAPTDV